MPHALSPRTLRRLAVLVATLLVLVSPVVAPRAEADTGVSAGDTVVGRIVRAWPEHENPTAQPDDGPLTWVRKSDGDAVRVPTSDVEHVPVGATVAVTLGDRVVDRATTRDGLVPAHDVVATKVVAAAAAPPAPPAPATAPATSAAAVTNQVTVVVAVPAGGTADGTTVGTVVNLVNGPVHDFWAEQSDGTIQLGATGVPGVLQLPVNCSDPYTLWDDAAAYATANAGWSAGPNRHLLVYLPKKSPGCAYGLAEIGSGISSGGMLYVTDTVTSVIAHELGHNFGLGHSSETQCDGTVDTGTCRTTSYRDYYDVMAASWDQVGSLTVGQAAQIGLLPAGGQQTVTWPGPGASVTLAPVSGHAGLRALRLVDPDGKVYWVEYRPSAGRDSWLGTAADWPGLQPGVLLRQDGPGPLSDTSLLLDGTPSRSSGWGADQQTALPTGSGVSFDYGMFTVTVDATSPTGAAVRVSTGPSLRSWSAARNRLPIGNWDSAGATDTTLRVSGWTFDPDSPTWTGQVHMYIDGAFGGVLAADADRPDVGAAFPPAGSAHGFSWSGQVSPGVHNVCLYAIDNEQPGAHSDLGCRRVAVAVTLPQGSWDALSAFGTTLSVSGWAFDPDAPSSTSTVHLYIDGNWGGALAAGGSRPDVGAAFPSAGGSHGFSWSGAVRPGLHLVCLYAIDLQLPGANSGLGCRWTAVAMRLPLGSWDGLSTAGTTLSVSGWAFDPDSATNASNVHVYVDGGWGAAVQAAGSRPDVGAAYPSAGALHGFSWSTTLAPGLHSVCLYAIDAEVPANTNLGCRWAAVAMTPPTGAWEGMTVSGSTLAVAGWGFDPDAPTSAISVDLTVDGVTTTLTADADRPDVGMAYPQAGSAHGWNWSGLPGSGAHTVCVSARDLQFASSTTSFGCRRVTVP